MEAPLPDSRRNAASGRPFTGKGVSVERIIDTAVLILDTAGLQALSTAEIARRLGVSQPTLYSHIANLDDIRSRTAIRGMAELSRTVRVAVEGRHGSDALRAMAAAYRDFVRAHPALYMLQQRAPATQEYWEEASRAREAVRDVLRGYGVPEEHVLDAHLVFRSWIHGFVDLEANNALRDVHDGSESGFELFLSILSAGYRDLASRPSRPSALGA